MRILDRTLRRLVRGESHGGGNKGEKGEELEGLHGELLLLCSFCTRVWVIFSSELFEVPEAGTTFVSDVCPS
jgi:hypothetical protein